MCANYVPLKKTQPVVLEGSCTNCHLSTQPYRITYTWIQNSIRALDGADSDCITSPNFRLCWVCTHPKSTPKEVRPERYQKNLHGVLHQHEGLSTLVYPTTSADHKKRRNLRRVFDSWDDLSGNILRLVFFPRYTHYLPRCKCCGHSSPSQDHSQPSLRRGNRPWIEQHSSEQHIWAKINLLSLEVYSSLWQVDYYVIYL